MATHFESLEQRQLMSSTNLVADIGGIYQHSSATTTNGTNFFTADDGVHGTELWKSVDGKATLVRDLTPGADGSGIGELRAFGDKAVFLRTFYDGNGHNTYQLWISDGTKSGTAAISGISANFVGASLIATDSHIVFLETANAIAGTPGRLWSSDGTRAGTQIIATMNDDNSRASFYTPVVVGDRIIEHTINTVWSTDGTAAGTIQIFHADSGNTIYNTYVYPVGQLSDGGNFLYWTPDQTLWSTDGTLAGTHAVIQVENYDFASSPTNANGLCFFGNGVDADTGKTEIWQTDGTAAGTHRAFVTDGYIYASVYANGKYFFSNYVTPVQDSVHGLEVIDQVIAFDPTTQQVTVVHQMQGIVGVQELTAVGNKAFFYDNIQNDNVLLYESDGTLAGTTFLKNIQSPTDLVAAGNDLVVTRTEGASPLVYSAADDASTDPVGPTTASVNLVGGVLRVFGTAGDDNIRIYQLDADHSRLVVDLDGVKHSFPMNLLSQIRVYGYDGNDSIAVVEKYGKLGIRTNIAGGGGNDILYTGGGRDTIDGGDGADTINAGNNDDSIEGGDGNDSIVAGNGNDTANGGDGADFVLGNKGNDDLCGGADDSSDTLDGSDGADVLYGQSVIDVFFGGSGKLDPNDTILN